MKKTIKKTHRSADSRFGRASIVLGVVQFVMTLLAFAYVLPDTTGFYSLLEGNSEMNVVSSSYIVFFAIFCMGIVNLYVGARLIAGESKKIPIYRSIVHLFVPASILLTIASWVYTYQLIRVPVFGH